MSQERERAVKGRNVIGENVHLFIGIIYVYFSRLFGLDWGWRGKISNGGKWASAQ